MSEAKHTPGPWEAYCNSQYWEVVPSSGRGKGRVPFTVSDVCASAPHDCNGGLQEANARLIAAAPDLLEALQELRQRAMHYGGANPQHDLLNAVTPLPDDHWEVRVKPDAMFVLTTFFQGLNP